MAARLLPCQSLDCRVTGLYCRQTQPGRQLWSSVSLQCSRFRGCVFPFHHPTHVSLAYLWISPVLRGTGLWPYSGAAAGGRDALRLVLGPRNIQLSFRRSPGVTAPSRTDHLWLPHSHPRTDLSGFLGSFSWPPPSPSSEQLVVLVITALPAGSIPCPSTTKLSGCAGLSAMSTLPYHLQTIIHHSL